MVKSALVSQLNKLVEIRSEVNSALAMLNDKGNLSLAQGLMLSACTIDLAPTLILDLGTGFGNSASVFAIASKAESRVLTFDIVHNWRASLENHLAPLAAKLECVEPIVGDILQFDFSQLLSNAERVLVFWDAHGFDIAEKVLGEIMPTIADRPHLIICHDMSDGRFTSPEGKHYGERRPWRGMDEFYRQSEQFGYVFTGWPVTLVDQVIPILDFCARNDIEFHSFDYDLHRLLPEEVTKSTLTSLDLPVHQCFHMGYFTMNETTSRNFPRSIFRPSSS